jgi:DNA-binding transcriptional LysR family regulator
MAMKTPTGLPFDVRDLECLVAVADEGHFGRAGHHLDITTSSLSKRIAKLEQRLGTPVFSRTSRQVRVTPQGALLVDAARRVLTEAEGFWQVARNASPGRLCELAIAYSPGNGEVVNRVMQSVRDLSPDLEFRLEQQLSRDVGDAVLAGRVSLGVCRGMQPTGLDTLTLSSLVRDHLVMPADHRLAACEEVTLSDLAGETLLASVPPHGASPPMFSYLAEHGVSVRYENWVAESQVMDSVAYGIGLTVLDRNFLRRNPRLDVVSRRLASDITPDPVNDYLVWKPDDEREGVRLFVSAARALFPPR